MSGADGVHLGQDDLPAVAARKLLGGGCRDWRFNSLYPTGLATHWLMEMPIILHLARSFRPLQKLILNLSSDSKISPRFENSSAKFLWWRSAELTGPIWPRSCGPGRLGGDDKRVLLPGRWIFHRNSDHCFWKLQTNNNCFYFLKIACIGRIGRS